MKVSVFVKWPLEIITTLYGVFGVHIFQIFTEKQATLDKIMHFGNLFKTTKPGQYHKVDTNIDMI